MIKYLHLQFKLARTDHYVVVIMRLEDKIVIIDRKQIILNSDAFGILR